MCQVLENQMCKMRKKKKNEIKSHDESHKVEEAFFHLLLVILALCSLVLFSTMKFNEFSQSFLHWGMARIRL